jgi:hypothetical protein
MVLVIKFEIMDYVKRVINHPLFIVCMFCAIIISGEQMGGFYLLYILLGLPHFVPHAILGVLGIVCLLFTYYNKQKMTFLLRVLGAAFTIASLLYFFLQPNGSYNYNTFNEALPLSTLVIFGIVVINFILRNIAGLLHLTGKKRHIT